MEVTGLVWMRRNLRLKQSRERSIPDYATSLKNAEYKACSGWRRRRRKIFFSYLCNHQSFSLQLRSNSFRQLLGECYVKRLAMYRFPLGYSRPRRLRSTKATFLSTNRCLCCVFRRSKSKLIWKCVREVGSRTTSLRTRSTNPSFGDQNWSSRWQVSCSLRFAWTKRSMNVILTNILTYTEVQGTFTCKSYMYAISNPFESVVVTTIKAKEANCLAGFNQSKRVIFLKFVYGDLDTELLKISISKF